MGGLAKVCKIYGGLIVKSKGKTHEYVYDYVREKPRLRNQMTKQELADSERVRWSRIKQQKQNNEF